MIRITASGVDYGYIDIRAVLYGTLNRISEQ